MLLKKGTLSFIFLFTAFLLSAEPQDNSRKVDSLVSLTSLYKGTQLVDLFIEIADAQKINEPDKAYESIEEAILLANQLNYQKGLAQAYLTKGIISNLNNSPYKSVEYFEDAKRIFSELGERRELAFIEVRLGDSYAQQGYFEKARSAYLEAISFFDYVGDYESLANAYYKNGTNYNMEGQYENALNDFKKSVEYYKNVGDLNGVGVATNSIGIVYHNQGNYKDAFIAWTEYADAMRELENWHRMSGALYNKGLIYLYWGAYDEALSLFTEALDLEEKSGSINYIADLYNSLGLVFRYSGNIEKSFEYYRKSVVYGEKLNSKQTVSVGLNNIGELFLDIGEPDSALYYVQKSLQIENTLFNKISIAQTKASMGKVYLALKKYYLAFSFLEQAEKVFDEVGDKKDLADVYQKFGQAYADIGNDTLSIIYTLRSIDIAEEIDLKRMQFENHHFLAQLYEQNGDFKNALFHQKQYQVINDSVFNQMALDKTSYLSIKLENEAQSKKLADLQHAQEVLAYKSKIKDSVVYFVSLIFVILAIAFYLRFTSNKRATNRLNDQYQILLESEEKIKALLDTSHDIVLLVDREGQIVSANTRAEVALRNGNQLVGYNFNEIVQPYFQNQFDPHLSRVMNQKTGREFTLISTSKHIYEITISPIFKYGIEVSGLAIYMHDITDIIAAREEKKKLEEQLFQVQKLESVGTMAGGVAHDFNNYLGTILGYSSMGFDDATEGSAAKRYFSHIISASRSAQHTVKKILTFSRKNENKKLSRVNLVDVAKEALTLVESTRPEEVEFKLDFGSDTIEILGDDIEIQQVFINLFTNAFHAMEGGGKGILECAVQYGIFSSEHRNVVSSIKGNNIAGICVTDNGMGMSQQVLKRIFEPFFTTKNVGSGTGLGLSVVHGIIKNHKGEMHVESKTGKGTRFYIYLPAIS